MAISSPKGNDSFTTGIHYAISQSVPNYLYNSINNIWQRAKNAIMNDLSNYELNSSYDNHYSYFTPRSPQFQSIMGWCNQKQTTIHDDSADNNNNNSFTDPIKESLLLPRYLEIFSVQNRISENSSKKDIIENLEKSKNEYERCLREKDTERNKIKKLNQIQRAKNILGKLYFRLIIAQLKDRIRVIDENKAHQQTIVNDLKERMTYYISDNIDNGIPRGRLSQFIRLLDILEQANSWNSFIKEKFTNFLNLAVEVCSNNLAAGECINIRNSFLAFTDLVFPKPDEPVFETILHECYPEYYNNPNEQRGSSLDDIDNESTKEFNFPKEKNFIQCMANRGFNSHTGSLHLESYWSIEHPEFINCSNSYSEHERIKKLIDLDIDCLNRFKNEAPIEEWENLIRLNNLSGYRTQRD